MISIEQINGEISALEEEKPTYVVMQKLADLYTVRDHMVMGAKSPTPSVAVSEVMPIIESESEFIQAVSGKNTRKVLDILDEAMEVVHALNPGLYNGVIRKLT